MKTGTLNRIHHVARGKMLGGSSGINYMAYVRPAAEDIDLWTKMGNKSWSWSDLWPYYLKSQSLDFKSGLQSDASQLCSSLEQSHGQSGPIKTSFPKRNEPIEDTIVAAFDKVCQLPRQKDPWNGSPLGLYRHLSTVDHDAGSVRSYAGTAYTKQALSNLKILTEATALHIVLQQEPCIARGIAFLHGQETYEVHAQREVIISLGTVGSPRLLELSGIGDPDILREAGVQCLVPSDMVGSRLQEHPMTSITYALKPEPTDEEHRQPGSVSLMAFVPYSLLVSSEELKRTTSKVESSISLNETERDSLIARLHSPTSGMIQYNGTSGFVDIGTGHANQSKLIAAVPGYDTCYTFHVTTTTNASRGSVHIQSADASVQPAIDIGLLNDPIDVELLAAGLEYADRVFSSHPDLADRVIRRIMPPHEVDLQDREQGGGFVRSWTTSFNHMLGTCAMGHVVDDQLRVKGVGGLRVVDASVMPSQISGNILATVYAIAEKAADMIKGHPTVP